MNIFIIIYFVSVVGAIIEFIGHIKKDGRLLLGEFILMLLVSFVPVVNTLLLVSLLEGIISSDAVLWKEKQ